MDTQCTSAHVRLTLSVAGILAVLVVGIMGFVAALFMQQFQQIDQSINAVALSVIEAVNQQQDADAALAQRVDEILLRVSGAE